MTGDTWEKTYKPAPERTGKEEEEEEEGTKPSNLKRESDRFCAWISQTNNG